MTELHSNIRRSAENARRRHRERKIGGGGAYDLPHLTTSGESSSGSSSSNELLNQHHMKKNINININQPISLSSSTSSSPTKRKKNKTTSPRRGRGAGGLDPPSLTLGPRNPKSRSPRGTATGRVPASSSRSPPRSTVPGRLPRRSPTNANANINTNPSTNHNNSTLEAAARRRRTLRRKPADNSILRGAHILRQQLLQQGGGSGGENEGISSAVVAEAELDHHHHYHHAEYENEEEETELLLLDEEDQRFENARYETHSDRQYNHTPHPQQRSSSNSHSPRRRRDYGHEDDDQEEFFSDASSDDWSDPWELPKTRSLPDQQGGRMTGEQRLLQQQQDEAVQLRITTSWPEDRSAFSFPTKGDASDWAELSSVGSGLSSFEERGGEEEAGSDRMMRSDVKQPVTPRFELCSPPPPPPPPGPPPSKAQQKQHQNDTQPQAQVSDDETYQTYMGRNRALKTKVVTYWVQRVDDMDGDSSTYNDSLLLDDSQQTDSSYYLPQNLRRRNDDPLLPPSALTDRDSSSSARRHTRDDDTGFMNVETALIPSSQGSTAVPQSKWDELQAKAQAGSRHLRSESQALPHHPGADELDHASVQDSESASAYDQKNLMEVAQQDPNVCILTVPPVLEHTIDPTVTVVSPESQHYNQLRKDPAFRHAQTAGILWQSLTSQHVRFPSGWWNGAHHPPMGVGERRLWNYVGRNRVQCNPILNYLVGNRGSGGRLLLHFVVRDLMTLVPVQDIAIGCFHPNARGIRTTEDFNPELEDCRDVWMAIRRRTEECSVVEPLLKPGDPGKYEEGDPELHPTASPLGGRHPVENHNMRPVFGQKAPLHTLFVVENELYELLSAPVTNGVAMPPALTLLETYLRL